MQLRQRSVMEINYYAGIMWHMMSEDSQTNIYGVSMYAIISVSKYFFKAYHL